MFRQRKKYFGKKMEQNYTSFVLKFGNKRQFFTIILIICVYKQILSVYTN